MKLDDRFIHMRKKFSKIVLKISVSFSPWHMLQESCSSGSWAGSSCLIRSDFDPPYLFPPKVVLSYVPTPRPLQGQTALTEAPGVSKRAQE